MWTESVTADGFRACVHEAVLFSGEHRAKIVCTLICSDFSIIGLHCIQYIYSIKGLEISFVVSTK